MLAAATLSLLLLLGAHEAAAKTPKNVTATGGGIVMPGDDLVLTYHVGAAWDRCYWFWYKSADEVSKCSYDLDEATGVAEMHKCEPSDRANNMTYSGTDAKVCQITVANVAEDANCTWATRLGDEMNPNPIKVVVASPVVEGTVEAPPMTAYSQQGPVTCTMKGGRPAPGVSMEVEGLEETSISNDSQIQTPNDKGVYETVQTFYVTATPDDHGRRVVCQAALFDKEGKQLFDSVSAETTLNVTFPPQEMANETDTVEEGQDATASFVFRANPPPTSVRWIVEKPTENNGGNETAANNTSASDAADNGSGNKLEIVAGAEVEKYVASELSSEGVQFTATLTIKECDAEVALNKFYLVAENSEGSQKYFYSLTVNDKDTESSTEGGTTGGSSGNNGTETGGSTADEKKPGLSKSVVALIVVGLALIACLGVGLWFFYERKRSRVNSGPLSGQESRP